MYTGRDVMCPFFLSHCNEILIFLDRFSKNYQISNFTKIRPVATKLFLAGEETDRQDEPNSRFSHFC